METVCAECGSHELEKDETRHEIICLDCGVAVESGILTNDVEFVECGQGQSAAVGSFVAHDNADNHSSLVRRLAGIARSSKEVSLARARAKVRDLATLLSLSESEINTACTMYEQCLSKGLSRGRKFGATIGACIYITNRTAEDGTLMLIDIADVLEMDVFELGRAYLRIANSLHVNLRAIDPCIFIHRFANRLAFGSRISQVAGTATRIVKRMKRDWISTGRRPSGLCGAALLISARIHGFNRSIDDIIRVVKIHPSTVQKRLKEFAGTESSDLTPEEFMNEDLQKECDPPAFSAARKRDEEQLIQTKKNLDEEVASLESEIQVVLDYHQHPLKTKPRNSKRKRDGTVDPTLEFIDESTVDAITECLENEQVDDPSDVSQSERTIPLVHPSSVPPLNPVTGVVDGTKWYVDESKEIDLMEGLDDAEIDSYIMSEQETKRKESLWLEINKEYLEEQREKKQREKEEEEQRIKEGRPEKQRRRYSRRKLDTSPCASTYEAMKKVVETYPMLKKQVDDESIRSMAGEGPTTKLIAKPIPKLHPTPIADKVACVFEAIKLKKKASKRQKSPGKLPVNLSEAPETLPEAEIEYQEDEECEDEPLEENEAEAPSWGAMISGLEQDVDDDY